MNNRNHIIYIMGHSRSGSTILNIMLGTLDNVAAAGETGNFYRSALLNDEFCSCGERFSKCEFWSPIKNSVQQKLTTQVSEYIAYSRQVENWRNLLFPGRMKRLDLSEKDYINSADYLYKTIFEKASASTLVDASKDPMRFHWLRKNDKYAFTLLHIVRDPRAVCWSQMQSFKKDLSSGLERDFKGKSIASTIKSLYVNAYTCERMKRKESNHLTINYDQLACGDTQPLTDIGRITGLNVDALQLKVTQRKELVQFHNAAGNRLRMNKSITVNYDNSWKTGLSKLQYLVITLVTLPLLFKYKFPVAWSPK